MPAIKKLRSKKLLAWLVVLVIAFSLLLPVGVLMGDDPDPGSSVIFTLADELARRGLSDGDALTSDGPLWVTAGTFTVTDSDGIHITDRTDDWNAVDIRREAVGVQAGDVIRVEGRVDGTPPEDTQMLIGGSSDPYNWITSVGVTDLDEAFTLEFTVTDAHMAESPSQFEGFRIQTNGSGATMSFFIDSIEVTRPNVYIFTLADELARRGLSDGDALTSDGPLWVTAGTFTVTDNDGIHITDRTDDWNAVDIRREAVGVQAGDVIRVEGRVDGTPPEDTQMLIGGSSDPYNWITSVGVTDLDEAFTLEFTVTDAHMAESPSQFEGFRIQTNVSGATMSFFIDSIYIIRPAEGGTDGDDDDDDFVLDPRDLVYSLATDVEFQAVADGTSYDGTDDFIYTYLNRSAAPTLTIIDEGGTNVIRITNRSAEISEPWSGLDVRVAPLNLLPGNSYRIVAEGRIDGTPPAGTAMVLGGSNNAVGEWPSYQTVTADSTDAEFSFDRTLTAAELLSMESIRFQSNGAGQYQSFYITSIEITVAEPVAPRNWDMSLPSLAETFSDYFLFGNIWSSASRVSAYNTDAFMSYQFNAITAENAHKPDQIASSSDPATWNYTVADEVVQWAEDRGMAMIGHTLVWHSQSPMWMTGRESTLVTRQEAMDNMELFISEYAGRYAGRIYSWDVVNEVFPSVISLSAWEANPNWRDHLRRDDIELGTNDLQWFNAFANNSEGLSGADFVFYAFYFTRQTDPNAILYYNDYNEQDPGKSMAIVQMITEINEEWTQHPDYDGRLLIEAFGMQSHHHLDQWATNFDDLHAALQRYADAGIRMSVSELDITIGGQGGSHPATLAAPLTDAQQERLAEAYGLVMSYYLEFADHIDRVSLWGLADDQSWRSWGHPLLFDGNSEVKAAFWAVINATANITDPDIEPTPTPTPDVTPTPELTPTPIPGSESDPTDTDSADTLPRTGEKPSSIFYSVGALVAGSGLLLGWVLMKKRKHQ